MKRIIVLVLSLAFALATPGAPRPSFGVSFQTTPTGTGHQTTATWKAPNDATTTTTYNIYRTGAACPAGGGVGTLSFVKLNTAPITALTYIDTTIGVGAWCYYVTAVTSGFESFPSTTSGGTALPESPQTLSAATF